MFSSKVVGRQQLFLPFEELTERDRGSVDDSLKSAMRTRVGSALAPAPVADKTFIPFFTQVAKRATCIHMKSEINSFQLCDMGGAL